MGGAVQTATNFIFECVSASQPGFNWRFLVSPQISDNLRSLGIDAGADQRFSIIERSPARCLQARRHVKALADAHNSDLVYTMSGPAYVGFDSLHLQGCSAPFVTHARLENYLAGGMTSGCRKAAESLVKLAFLHRSDHLVFQTQSSRDGFVRRSFWHKDKTSVVPNALGHAFHERLPPGGERQVRGDTLVRILVPSAYYLHKNLQSIPETALHLSRLTERPFLFSLTIPFDDNWHAIKAKADQIGVADRIQNLGTFPVSQAPSLYLQSDMMFLPTRLETFSASYLEAMYCGVPIVTSDLDFARDICRDAALYADTLSPASSAAVLAQLINSLTSENGRLHIDLAGRGIQRVANFPTSKDRHEMILDVIDLVRRRHGI